MSPYSDSAFADMLSVLSDFLPPDSEVIGYVEYLRNSDNSVIDAFIDVAFQHPVVSSAMPYVREITAGADKMHVADRLVCFIDARYPALMLEISKDDALVDKFAYAILRIAGKLCESQ